MKDKINITISTKDLEALSLAADVLNSVANGAENSSKYTDCASKLMTIYKRGIKEKFNPSKR